MIEYLPGESGAPEPASEVEFVGGPRSGQRATLTVRPGSIPGVGGMYRRSVACADDRALRYVWVPGAGTNLPNPPGKSG